MDAKTVARQIALHRALRAKYAKQKRKALVKLEDAQIARLLRIQAQQQKPKPPSKRGWFPRRRPTPQPKRTDGRGGAAHPKPKSKGAPAAPERKPWLQRVMRVTAASMVAPLMPGAAMMIATGRDRYALVLITKKNASMLSAHYEALLAKAHRLDPHRKIYEARLRRARALLAKAPGPAPRRAPPAQLRQRIAEQKRLARLARARRNYAAAQQHDENVQNYEREINAQEMEAQLPARPPMPEGDLPFRPRGGDGAQAQDAEKSPEGSEGETEADLEQPWYKRYAVPLLVAAAIGAAVALRNPKKGGATLRGGKPAKRIAFRGGPSDKSGANAPSFLP